MADAQAFRRPTGFGFVSMLVIGSLPVDSQEILVGTAGAFARGGPASLLNIRVSVPCPVG
jgi:hypothetical protein